jgi:hypothetical protein
MQDRFRTQAEHYLRLAEFAETLDDRAQFLDMACAWHRLAQNQDLRRSQQSAKPAFAIHPRHAAA